MQVTIENKTYEAIQIPDTQEDNAGGISGKWELWENGEKIGRLIEWEGGKSGYCTVIGNQRKTHPGRHIILQIS